MPTHNRRAQQSTPPACPPRPCDLPLLHASSNSPDITCQSANNVNTLTPYFGKTKPISASLPRVRVHVHRQSPTPPPSISAYNTSSTSASSPTQKAQSVQTDTLPHGACICCPSPEASSNSSVATIRISTSLAEDTYTTNEPISPAHRASIACVCVQTLESHTISSSSCSNSDSICSSLASICDSKRKSITSTTTVSDSGISARKAVVALPVSSSFTAISCQSKANAGVKGERLSPLNSPHGFRSGYTQLQVTEGSLGIRHQYKRSSYPSGLKISTLRIGPRLCKDKSKSRLANFYAIVQEPFI